ncbi:hypothetical protein PMAYCL1PPCAC_21013, partial [Pristionchus mayeri]
LSGYKELVGMSFVCGCKRGRGKDLVLVPVNAGPSHVGGDYGVRKHNIGPSWQHEALVIHANDHNILRCIGRFERRAEMVLDEERFSLCIEEECLPSVIGVRSSGRLILRSDRPEGNTLSEICFEE